MSQRRVRVGPGADLGRGEARTVPLSPDPDRGYPRRAVVVRDRHGVPRAFVNLCKHLPIPLDAGSGEFLDDERVHLVCGTHGALFRPEDGLCVWGPCEGEALDALAIVEEDGVLYVVEPEVR